MTRNHSLLHFLLLFAALPCSLSAQTPTADCAHALFVCDKKPLLIQALPDAGQQDESGSVPCLTAPFAETNSVWLTWQVAEVGTLEFSILPDDPKNDLDFVLYRLKGSGDCADKEPLRCMAAGPSLGQAEPPLNTCTGATGLRSASEGINQSSGCATGTDNFLSPVEVQQGERYVLWINNFRSTGGATVEWGGTAAFQRVEKFCPLVPMAKDLAESKVQFSPLWPDPATSRISTTVQNPAPAEGMLWVTDGQGRILHSRSLALPAGESLLSTDTDLLPVGVYFLKISLYDTVWLSRFVKER